MHVRVQRAAVAVEPTLSSVTHPGPKTCGPRAPADAARVLWSSSALLVQAGRLIGVRLRGSSVEVALVRNGADQLRWIPAQEVLTEQQVDLWLRTSRFAP